MEAGISHPPSTVYTPTQLVSHGIYLTEMKANQNDQNLMTSVILTTVNFNIEIMRIVRKSMGYSYKIL